MRQKEGTVGKRLDVLLKLILKDNYVNFFRLGKCPTVKPLD